MYPIIYHVSGCNSLFEDYDERGLVYAENLQDATKKLEKYYGVDEITKLTTKYFTDTQDVLPLPRSILKEIENEY